jgi:hypothetical protein
MIDDADVQPRRVSSFLLHLPRTFQNPNDDLRRTQSRKN